MTLPASEGSRTLARRLVECDGDGDPSPDARFAAAARAIQRVRLITVRLIGDQAARALELRALWRAGPEYRFLEDAIAARWAGHAAGDAWAAVEGLMAEQVADGIEELLAQVLDLLATFLGEDLRDRLVRQEWREAPGDQTDGSREAQ